MFLSFFSSMTVHGDIHCPTWYLLLQLSPSICLFSQQHFYPFTGNIFCYREFWKICFLNIRKCMTIYCEIFRIHMNHFSQKKLDLIICIFLSISFILFVLKLILEHILDHLGKTSIIVRKLYIFLHCFKKVFRNYSTNYL